jgi:hypothetical protein
MLYKMRFLVDTKLKMKGNLVCLLGTFVSSSTSVFSLITVNKLKTYTRNTRAIPLFTYAALALISSYALLTYAFLVLQDLADSGWAALACILCFPAVALGAVEEALLKQVLPSIRRLRGSRTPPIRTTTSLEPTKVIMTYSIVV